MACIAAQLLLDWCVLTSQAGTSSSAKKHEPLLPICQGCGMLTHQHHALLLLWAVCWMWPCGDNWPQGGSAWMLSPDISVTTLSGSMTLASPPPSCCQARAFPLQVAGLVTASDRTVSRRVDLAMHELAGAMADDRATAAVSACSSTHSRQSWAVSGWHNGSAFSHELPGAVGGERVTAAVDSQQLCISEAILCIVRAAQSLHRLLAGGYGRRQRCCRQRLLAGLQL